jgi:hypothetical protein
MRSRLRSLDSRISFFAFADIITAVSGVLIFVALLLATDLGRPTDNHSPAADSETARQLQKTLAQQAEADAQNQRLQELLANADTAPDLGKLQVDISKLNAQLAEEQKKQAAVAAQMADSQASMAARDKVLGLADLKATIQRLVRESESIAQKDATARGEMEKLDQQVALQQSKLLKLREREGQLWLIPDKSSTTKEPILVTVAGAGVTIEHFDHPDQRKQLDKAGVNTDFQSYLREAKALDQYVVFLVRPSGIETFQDLVKSARDLGFDVGFDALEEDRQIHFSTPPPVDEAPKPGSSTNAPVQNTSATNSNSGTPAKAAPTGSPLGWRQKPGGFIVAG